jgi:uncharacterized protein (DUF302 family)
MKRNNMKGGIVLVRVLMRVLLIGWFALAASSVNAQQGLVSVASSHGVEDTASRLETIFAEKGMTVFNRIKHSAAAAKLDMALRPTELLIFGNPKLGSKLMQCEQSIGLDLPLKVLVWEDAKGQVWISYTEPKYLKEKYSVEGCDPVFEKMDKALGMMSKKAAEG